MTARCCCASLKGPPFPAAAKLVYFNILLFVMANISQVYLINFIKCLCDNNITKQVYVVFLLYEALCTLLLRVLR